MIIWVLNALLLGLLLGLLISDRLGDGLQVAIQRVVYDEPRTSMVEIRVRRGSLAWS